MKKKAKITTKIFALLLTLVIFISGGVTTTKAADAVTKRIGPYQLSYGVSNVHYYITNSVLEHSLGSTLVTLIDNAANSWVYTGYGYNPLYMYRTYNLYASNIDIFASTDAIEGYNKVNSSYWVGNSANCTQTNPWNSNWDYAEVTIFVDMHDPNNLNKLQRSIAHGMGHAFGLDDNYNNQDSVMCDFYHTCNVYKPGKADHDGLNAIYNN